MPQTIAVYELPTEGIRDVLGFTTQIITYKGVEAGFTASSPLNALVMPKNLIVEVQSLQLDSMDGGLGKRRNILAVIPNLNIQNNNNLIYETNNPIMLEINNQFDLNLRSLRVRILTRSDENDQLINVADQIELTMVLS